MACTILDIAVTGGGRTRSVEAWHGHYSSARRADDGLPLFAVADVLEGLESGAQSGEFEAGGTHYVWSVRDEWSE